MAKKIPVKVRIPAGPTMVWKKDRFGRLKPTMVRRKAYTKTVWIKKDY